MKTNNLLLIGAVSIGAFLIYNKMKKNSNPPMGSETKLTPVSNTQPAIGKAVKMNVCPTKEQMARTRYTEEGMAQLKAMGCI
jgi:hypothetical protein